MNDKKLTVIKGKGISMTTNPNPGRKPRVCAYCRVSTNTAEQKDSFDSQVKYHSELIGENPAWEYAGIYADQGITGTKAEARPEFLRMIGDAMDGKIDIILTKSISRFSRNTLDMLNYVRMLKDKRVEVRFEEDRLNTLSQEGELMITLLSSLAQQEVVNTSEHVKKGLQMKMTAGELVGYSNCLGYTVDPKTKELTIVPEEAEIVRYIFRRYNEGAGTTILARELEEHGWKTKYGKKKWSDTTILGIIKNEKYKGDLLQGKTFTVDPISKKRTENHGESDQYYVTDHHPAIVSKEDWEKANERRQRLSYARRTNPDGTRVRFSREYTFSSTLECGFCGRGLSRRAWNNSKHYSKVVWQCLSYAKSGKESCEHSKGIPEDALEGAFVEAYNRIVGSDDSFLKEFLSRSGGYISDGSLELSKAKNAKGIEANQAKIDRLAGIFVDGTMSEDAYQAKLRALNSEKQRLLKEKEDLDFKQQMEIDATSRIAAFKKAAVECSGKKLEAFSKELFDACVDKVVVGGYDPNGNPEPYTFTFFFKSELGDAGQSSENKTAHQIVSEFNFFYQHSVFKEVGKYGRRKELENYIKVKIAV